MRNKTVALAIMMVLCVSVAAQAKYSGGMGMPNDPYLIATAEDMDAIGANPDDWDAHFLLVADINLADYNDTQFNIVGDYFGNKPFTGVFDGNNHKVWNFTWTTAERSYFGLFGYVGSGGKIKNLGVENVNINAIRYVGGLVGYNLGTITNCYSTGSISGCENIGGLVGENDGTISNSYSTGNVNGTGNWRCTGGLVGYNDGTITNCYSTGSVSGDEYVGGLVGFNVGTITNCYSTGSVSGSSYVGGLVGVNYYGTITNCYSTGSVSGYERVGGLVGKRYSWEDGGIVRRSFWDVNTSGQTASDGGTGKTTAEMKTAGTYFGWNGCNEIIWTIDEGNDYPHLAWEGQPGQPIPGQQLSDFLEGSGTQDDPYRVSTPKELNLIGAFPCEWDRHFLLIDDINLAEYTGTQFNIIGTDSYHPFTGVFDGNGHKIWNFTWTSTDSRSCVGLFGFVGDGAQIKNLGIENANINTADGDYIGGLVGCSNGAISNCSSTGNVTGGGDSSDYVGGLVGENYYGTITNCYSTASVEGYAHIGGIVGRNNEGLISNCYSTGRVSGRDYVGGLVGDNSGGVLNSFWDRNTSGRATSDGGTGKTTAEMKTAGTYFGWNGCGEIIWTIDEGNDYPRLAWEGKPGQPIPDQQLSDYMPGSGTDSDPYLISTAQQLNLIGLFPCEWDKNFSLIADINMADYSGTQVNIIGRHSRPFTGVFDGNNHKIWNFTWDSNDVSYIGLFGYVAGTGQIKNVSMESVNINVANKHYVGSLVGDNDGTITSCYATGSVSGGGGLVGDNDENGTITGCYFTGSVSGEYLYFGGLVCSNYGVIAECYSTGVVNCTNLADAGGLVGYNDGMIINCYFTGSVSGEYMHVGGLAGINYGTITRCYSASSVLGCDSVGGLAGINYYNGTISNCYAVGAVHGNDYIGGLLGANQGAISNCYAAASVDGNDYAGGLVGGDEDANDVFSCFWDVNTSGQTSSAGGEPKTTAEMKTAGTYSGWNDCGVIIWTLDEGNDYPHLVWEGQPGQPIPGQQLSDFLTGSGTQEDPYRIFTAEQLNLIGLFTCELDKHFILMNDIDLSAYAGGLYGPYFNIIGDADNPFTGVFDGNDHRILNFTYVYISWSDEYTSWDYPYARRDYIGLFGYVAGPGQVKNIGMENVNIDFMEGVYDYIGGLVGYNYYGAITNCYSTGKINEESIYIGGYTNFVGGLVGYNHGASMSDCYSTCSTQGMNCIGGLVGWNNYGTITNCYTAGSVWGSMWIGGLVGVSDYSTITNCYSAGDVSGGLAGGLVGESDYSTITRCYFTGSVSGVYCIGGLMGWNYGTINSCYSTGSVSGHDYYHAEGMIYVGGLVGKNRGAMNNCYSTGGVLGRDEYLPENMIYAGGLVSNNRGMITNCYSTGSVSGEGAALSLFSFGGLVGLNDDGAATASFWEVNTSGQTSSAGGTGLPTAQMQIGSTFIGAGWDFICETENGTDDVWTIQEAVDYPKLVWDVGCFPYGHEDYDEWIAAGKPLCWCCPRQCHGDTDSQKEGSAKAGYYYVHFKDLGLLLSAWNIKEPPHGSGIVWPDPDICADFDHAIEGSTNTGYWRVHYNDLNIFLSNWSVKEPPDGPGIEPDCLNCP